MVEEPTDEDAGTAKSPWALRPDSPPAPKLPFDPGAKPSRSDSDQGDASPTPIDQTDRNDVMAFIRDVFSDGETRDRDTAIHDVADALGYARVGINIRDTLDADIRTAVRRGILDNSNSQLVLLCRSIEGYKLDHLVNMLTADIGSRWWDRDELIIGTARYMGYRRTGARITKAFKSAINAAIRRGKLEADGGRVRRA